MCWHKKGVSTLEGLKRQSKLVIVRSSTEHVSHVHIVRTSCEKPLSNLPSDDSLHGEILIKGVMGK